ncbi:hypothetical protein ES332_A05G075300v1 [Gossypium tomentosum]|uniref:Cyclin-dependent protein kinase inhibitor SMR13 n=1 Tax=Gossypium tomentosum TaxID=34277 RepID=A0A5D2QBH4_GOSTO|nr:hypothetical protein ES332_A05G075300v1 [Gossypium tomentosum]
MAPSSRRGKTTRNASKPRRSKYTKKLVKPSINIQTSTSATLEDSASKIDDRFALDHNIEGDGDVSTTSPCSTPKAQRYRIPEIHTCPPAPKKRRSVPSNCSLQRTPPIAFFASQDLELFFFFAFRDISV